MEKQSIFQAINSVEKNLSTIFTKQDVVNLLNTIDVDNITTENEIKWKKSSEDFLLMYQNEFEKRNKLQDEYKQMYERLTYVKNRLWNFNKSADNELYVYELIENENDKDFIDNMKFVIQNDKLEYLNEAIEMYKSENNLIDHTKLYDNFERRVRGFEFDDLISSCDFEINNGNEIEISSFGINKYNILDELDSAIEECK
jgi:hypothetical protein